MDPSKVCLFIPGNLQKFKLNLFERIGRDIVSRGGSVIRGDAKALASLPNDITPIVGCMPELTGLILKWKAEKRPRWQWDRGYARRVFATYLPKAASLETSFYRWHLNDFQMREIKPYPSDRWDRLKIEVTPWQKGGSHIVVAAPTPTYQKFHAIETWLEDTLRQLATVTDRQIVVRFKDSKRPLQADLKGAHALVANGSIAAVEAAILGCPVFDNPESAAALVGETDVCMIERPAYPDRQPWLNALAYSQFDETEMANGDMWRMLS